MTQRTFMSPTIANKRKKGFTLTEIAIVLGIIGLILGAIWVAAASVYQNQRTAHADTAILQIAQGVRTLYATTSQFAAGGDITNDMATAKVIPSDMVAGAAGAYTAIDPWAGGTTKVLVPAASLDSFTIEMTDVPQAPALGCCHPSQARRVTKVYSLQLLLLRPARPCRMQQQLALP